MTYVCVATIRAQTAEEAREVAEGNLAEPDDIWSIEVREQDD